MDEQMVIPARRGRFGVTTWIGGAVLAVMVVACLGTLPWSIWWHNRQKLDLAIHKPSVAPVTMTYHSSQTGADGQVQRVEQRARSRLFMMLGTDKLGRSVLVRCALGGAISLGIGLAAAAIAVIIGTGWGMITGYMGGRTDACMMRIVDILYGLPYIVIVLLIVVAVDGLMDRLIAMQVAAHQAAAAAGQAPDEPFWLRLAQDHRWAINLLSLLVAIGAVSWLTLARVVRGQVLSLKSQPFIEAAKAGGVPTRRILLRHILPNLMGPIIVYTTLTVPQAILQESFLSFLGIGVQSPLPSWGNLASDGLIELNPVGSRWWLLTWPCVLLGVTLLSLNFLGDGLRDRLDPHAVRNA